jgi:hypothetical protein
VARQPLTFLCFAKERVSKRKATADLPFGFPFMCCKKWEMSETRCAQTSDISDPFSAAHKRLRPERNSKATARSKARSKNPIISSVAFMGEAFEQSGLSLFLI